MCGRTATTLNKDALIQACTFGKNKDKLNNDSGVQNMGNNIKEQKIEDAEENNDDLVLLPIWTEAPCGGEYVPSANIPPTAYTPILYKNSANKMVLQPMLWGLIPSWHPGPDPKSHRLTTNNCRIENVVNSKLYKPCLSKGRCVVICEGFYEWDRSGSTKQPYMVYNSKGKVLFMAGLYSTWKGDDGAPIYNYTIITRESNKTLSWLHHRMPNFLLSPKQITDWLDSSINYTQALSMLSQSLPTEEDVKWHPVSKEVGNVRNQGSDLMNKVEIDKDSKKRSHEVSSASKGIMSNWLKRSKK